MFSATNFGDVTKQQIISAVKKLKLNVCTSNSSTDIMTFALANAFIERKFVKLETENLAKVTRSDACKLKDF